MNEEVEKAVRKGSLEAMDWSIVRDLKKAAAVMGASSEILKTLAYRLEINIGKRAVRESIDWAAGVRADRTAVVLAIATTGFDDPIDVVEVAVLSMEGKTLLYDRVRPATHDGGDPIEIEDGASALHGHTAASLASAPTFADVYPRLLEVLRDEDTPKGRRVVVYNAPYVLGVLSQTAARYGLEGIEAARVEDAMTFYSREAGKWLEDREDYYPKTLPGWVGTALGDARATLKLLEY